MHDQQQQPPGSEQQQETEAERNERLAIVEAFAETVKEKRKDAIKGRHESGIEDIWAEDEEFYEGIDDANRATAKTVKGRSMTEGPREVKSEATATRSTVFLNITRAYVDAAAARTGDMLLPTDDRNFALRHSPTPELTAMLEDKTLVEPAAVPMPAPPAAAQPPQGLMAGLRTRVASVFGAGQGVPPAVAQQQPMTVADQAKAVIDKAKKSAERAQQEIDDWLTECRYHGEVRHVIESAARVGVGILKGPVPANVRKRAAKKNPDGSWSVEIKQSLKPQSRWVNHWNFYPDRNCGTDIQRGSYVFERDDITGRGLMDLQRDPGYIREMIDMVLAEGPTDPVDGKRKLEEGQQTSEKDLFEIWYFHGMVSKKEMEAAGCKCKGDKQMYPCQVTMVNDRVIKVTLSVLDSGEFPYDVMVWQARKDHWAGIGVARQMRACQKGATAATRAMMDNAGLTAGPQIVIDRNKLTPADGNWGLRPNKLWYSKGGEEGEPIEDVRKAFQVVIIQSAQVELMNIVQFWLQKAEEVTGLPMLLQGQMGAAAVTDKVGIANIMNNNGSTVLRRIARNFDDRITEPHIGRYYEWLLLYGPDEAKGDFTIDARGSSALVERELQVQQLVQLIAMSLNPAYGLDPEAVMREFLKSMRFDPKGLEYSDEKKEQMAKNPPPEDPRIAAARIMAASREKVTGDQLAAKAMLEKAERDAKAVQEAANRDLQKVLAKVQERIALIEIDSDERQHLEEMKVELAKVTLQLKTQENLAVGHAAVDIHKHRNPSPQVAEAGAEPPQRAPAGDAFVQ